MVRADSGRHHRRHRHRCRRLCDGPVQTTADFVTARYFGDGSTGSTGSEALSHTYAFAGTYTVTVTATDEYGKTGTTSRTIAISGPPDVSAARRLIIRLRAIRNSQPRNDPRAGSGS